MVKRECQALIKEHYPGKVDVEYAIAMSSLEPRLCKLKAKWLFHADGD
ncbi:MAG: hypothetical protein AAFW67_08190 [Cyanobacteria bacterium J06638_38]